MGKDQEEKSQESNIKILKLDKEREGAKIGRERKEIWLDPKNLYKKNALYIYTGN